MKSTQSMALIGAIGLLLIGRTSADAHCDSIDGPVVTEALAALQAKDIKPVLKWVGTENEPELKKAFSRTLGVRSGGKAAKELADQFFLETLVRLHREGEGAPYTGLKPKGTPLEPGIEAADKALEKGSIEPVVEQMTAAAAEGIRTRFNAVIEKKQHANQSVNAGREYVASYVEYIHYVEALEKAATKKAQPYGHDHGTLAATDESAPACSAHSR